MGDSENGFGKAMRIRRMDVALDHVISHQPVDDIGTFALCGAEDQRIPEKIALIDKAIGADALALAKILTYTEFLSQQCNYSQGLLGGLLRCPR